MNRKSINEITSDELDALYDELDAVRSDLAELTQSRQHGAFTFCPQLVGHVTAEAFALKISEKRNAIGQRAEAVQYANEQRQRAEQAEAAIERVMDLDVPDMAAAINPAYALGWKDALALARGVLASAQRTQAATGSEQS